MALKQTHVSSDGRERSCRTAPSRCPSVLRQGTNSLITHHCYLDGEKLTDQQYEQVIYLHENYGHLTYVPEENYSKNLNRFIRTQLTVNETGDYVLIDTLEQKTLIAAHPLTAQHIKAELYRQYLQQENPSQPGNPFGQSSGFESIPEHVKELYLCQNFNQIFRDRHLVRWEQVDSHIQNGVPVDLATQLVYPQGALEGEVLNFQNVYSKHLTETTATIIEKLQECPLDITEQYLEIATLEGYLQNNPYLHTHPEVQRIIEVITQPEQLHTVESQFLINSILQNPSFLNEGNRGILDRLVDTRVPETLINLYVHHPTLLTQPKHQQNLHEILQDPDLPDEVDAHPISYELKIPVLSHLASQPEILTLPSQTIWLLLQDPESHSGFAQNPHIHQRPQILRYLKKADPDWPALYCIQNPNIHHFPKLVHQILKNPEEEDHLSLLLMKPELFNPDLINHPTYGSKILRLIHQQVTRNPDEVAPLVAWNPKIGDPEQQETLQHVLQASPEAVARVMICSPSLPNPLPVLVESYIHGMFKQDDVTAINALSFNPVLINHPELTETIYQHLKKTGNVENLVYFAQNPAIYHYPNIFRELLSHSNSKVRFFAYGQ